MKNKKDSLEEAKTYNKLGKDSYCIGEVDKAIEYKALKIRLKKLGEEHPDTADTYNDLGVAYEAKGEYDKSIEYYKKALKINLNGHKCCSCLRYMAKSSYNLHNLGVAYREKGEFETAINFFKKAIIYIMNVGEVGEEDEFLDKVYYNLGVTYHKWFSHKKEIEDKNNQKN